MNDTFFDPGHAIVAGLKFVVGKQVDTGIKVFWKWWKIPVTPALLRSVSVLGKELLFQYIRNFGFGSKTGIDLNGEAQVFFPLERVDRWSWPPRPLAQGVSVTRCRQVTAWRRP